MSDRPFVARSEPDEDGLVELVLDRAERRNALGAAAIAELTAALEEVGRSDARGVILGAAGPVFCAGHDYADMVDRDLAAMTALLSDCARMMRTVTEIPQPVLARVQGLATGAGCQLALSCDLVIAADMAAFQTPGGKAGWFCTTPMVAVSRAVGSKRALEMLLTGEPVDAKRALEWGMINRVVTEEELASAARDLLRSATRGCPGSKGIGKQAFYAQVDLDLGAAYEHAVGVMARSSQREPAQAGFRAFVDRRKKKKES